jgi:hypothetical protein
MLSGSVPFNDKNDDQIIENITKGTFTMKSKFWTTVPRKLRPGTADYEEGLGEQTDI